MAALPIPDHESLTDIELARRIAVRDAQAVRIVTGRNNQRLFRAAWSILRDRSEAEDAVQSAYLRAFMRIGDFEGRSSLSTWLTRIVINESLGRARAARRRRAHFDAASVVDLEHYRETLMNGSRKSPPDGELARTQIRHLLEEAIDALPVAFRTVFVLREIEGLDVEETAESLNILPATVKTRHLRARRRLRESLAPEVGAALAGTFPFAGLDCESMTERIVERFCRGGEHPPAA